jgi:hypothetical protein
MTWELAGTPPERSLATMDMDDDDFMGEIEFDLSPEQGEVIRRAITLAASSQGDEFIALNPLIAIMQWWSAGAISPVTNSSTRWPTFV